MAFSSFPDVFSWIIQNFHSKNTKNSINLCSSSSSQPSLKLLINNHNKSCLSLSIIADYNLPISLWTSKKIIPKSNKLLNNDNNNNSNNDTVLILLKNFIEDILKYSPNKLNSNLLKLPQTQHINLKDMFNFSFLSLAFVVCIYEAPADLRSSCLHTLKNQLACPKARLVSRDIMRLVGSDVEEKLMRSVNLAITNWISEMKAAAGGDVEIMPSALFSYSFSTVGLWKVEVYCPVMAMTVEKCSGTSPDERLLFSLNYHQLEGVIQLNHRVTVREKWIDVMVSTDNIRCDVIKLLSDTLLRSRGAGSSEKHFPSRISLQITPTLQSNVLSISVSKSSENPPTEIGVEKGFEASFDPPTAVGLHLSAGETITTSLKPWKFEQSVHGNTVGLNWFLHDSADGREVFSSKPSKLALLHPKAWFKNRYSNVHRPFTRQGGVVFAGDEYGERVSWKVDRACAGGSMEWEVKGWIWLTYWPNKHRTFYTETRRLEFKEVVDLSLV